MAARRVADGDLSQRVKVRGGREIAELGESFNTMAETLSREHDLRQNLMADIAHELRTPLTILQGNTEAMLDGVLETNRESLTSLHQETVLLARLVEDLRTLSLADAGQLRLQPGALDLKEVCQQVVRGFQPQLADRGVHLSLEAPGALPAVRADADRTAQVLRNLLSNAAHYTPDGGSITVSAQAEPGGVAVTVADTGSGIPAEDLPRVFDRFYRVDRSRARSSGGSGLGLAIVRQLVEAQGGGVRAESVPGQGSTFSFCLPYSG